MIPPKDEVTVCFAHVAYNLQTRFAKRKTGIGCLQVWNRDELDARVGEADVLVISGLWRNDLVEKATRLRFIQSIGAGTDQFGRGVLSARGIRLASASGVNMKAVSEHAMALILALARRLPKAFAKRASRPPILPRPMKTSLVARRSSSSVWAVSAGGWRVWRRPSTCT